MSAGVSGQPCRSHILTPLFLPLCLLLTNPPLRPSTSSPACSKNLWSPSFVFVIAGLDYLCLAALYWIVDIAKLWSGAPFVYAGASGCCCGGLGRRMQPV